MDWKNLGNAIANSAPILGQSLGGPAGAAIGVLLSHVFGVETNDPADVLKKIQADPGSYIKLIEIQNSYELSLQKQVFDDKASARNRDVEKAKAGVIDNTPRNLAYIDTFGLYIIVFLLFAKIDIQGPERDILMALTGALIASHNNVRNYYFGSSMGSRIKDISNNIREKVNEWRNPDK